MAIFRDDPYSNFNFLVSIIGGAEPATVEAGFFEVILPSAEIDVVDYRAGNERTASPRTVTGVTKYSNVVLRRGLIGSTDLWEWFKDVRDGGTDRRDVEVTLLDEARQPVMKWKLKNCLPVKYAGPSLIASSGSPAIEELTLSVGEMEIE